MNHEIKIEEPILRSDYDAIKGIVEENIFYYDKIEEDFKAYPSGELLVAKNGDVVVGIVSLYSPDRLSKKFSDEFIDYQSIKVRRENISYISLLAVKKCYQRQGIGKLLIAEAINNIKKFGSKAIVVHVWEKSPGGASEKLFKSLGFSQIRTIKQSWYKNSIDMGPKRFLCIVCGNPCVCDELEMVKYI